MTAVKTLKKITEKATEWARPALDDLDRFVRARKPWTVRFKEDGIIPNHPQWPLVLYRGVVRLSHGAAISFRTFFQRFSSSEAPC